MRLKPFPTKRPEVVSSVATSKRRSLLFRFIHLPGLISKYDVVCGNSHQTGTETHGEGWDATHSYPGCTSTAHVPMNQGNLRQAAAHRGGLRIGELHTPVWWSPPEGLGLHGAAATSSSFGLSKPCGGAVFFPNTAGPASSSMAAGAKSQEARGCGAQIDNCVHWLFVPSSTSFIMSKSFVSQKEPMQWAARRQDLGKIEHTKKVWPIAMTGLRWSLVMEWN